jgi:phosphohistidine phosphatase SixA
MRLTRRMMLVFAGLSAAVAGTLPVEAGAEGLDAPTLKALRAGGYVLIMRHASSPASPPAPGTADPDNVGGERQLDAEGRSSAAKIGEAMRKLGIPIGRVWSSPTFRALQTVRLAGWPSPTTAVELGDRGVSMQAASGEQVAWLKSKASERPASGTVTVIVTHYPNLAAAFGEAAAGMADSEAMVFRPDGGAPKLVSRIKGDEWLALAGGSASGGR